MAPHLHPAFVFSLHHLRVGQRPGSSSKVPMISGTRSMKDRDDWVQMARRTGRLRQSDETD
jgi:hypothetical protein